MEDSFQKLLGNPNASDVSTIHVFIASDRLWTCVALILLIIDAAADDGVLGPLLIVLVILSSQQ